jgi:hypothetical protein
MIDTDEITKRLDTLEQGRAQDMRLVLARFDAIEADVTALSKRQESQFVILDHTIREVDSRLSAHLSRLENMLEALTGMTGKLLAKLEE